MNPHDPRDPDLDDVTDDDVLVSAYLDGETTPEEAAKVEADPDLLARAETLGHISHLFGEPPEPNPARRDAAVNAALSASATTPLDGAPSDTASDVSAAVRLDDHRAKRQRYLKFASIAAAVVVAAVIAVPVLRSLGGDSTQQATVDTASSDADAGDESGADRLESDDALGRGGQELFDSDSLAEADGGLAAEEALPATGGAPVGLQIIELGRFDDRSRALRAVDTELAAALSDPPAVGGITDDPADTNADAPTTPPLLEAVCPSLFSRQQINTDSVVWWARYDVGPDTHDYIVFARADPTDPPNLYRFIDVTTACRIVETGVVDPD